jgi:hypothetical protein
MNIRAINPFGPKPGEYVPGSETDLRATFHRLHWAQYYDQAIAQGLTGEEAAKLADSMTEAK